MADPCRPQFQLFEVGRKAVPKKWRVGKANAGRFDGPGQGLVLHWFRAGFVVSLYQIIPLMPHGQNAAVVRVDTLGCQKRCLEVIMNGFALWQFSWGAGKTCDIQFLNIQGVMTSRVGCDS